MKKLIFISIIVLLLSACSDDSTISTHSSTNVSKKTTISKNEELKACSILSEKYITSIFPGATIERLEDSAGANPLCNIDLDKDGASYTMHLTLGVLGGANEAMLDGSVSYFKKDMVKSISGVGEKAYSKSGMMGQISALKNGNLIHFGIRKDLKYDEELSKKIIIDMFDVLEQK